MIYRENGQFKVNYRADQQIFPIAQDRIFIFGLLAFAFVVVPMLSSDYMLKAILIPFLILSLAAIGVNILVGYCGQISLGSGAFMAVGAYMAYNVFVRIDGMPLIIALLSGGFFATIVGVIFGIPSLRVKGLYLAVATLAAQFFCDWAFSRISWFTNNNSSGSVAVSNLEVLAGRSTRRSTNISFAWVLWLSLPCWRKFLSALRSAANGWRYEIWMSLPQSLASGRSMQSSLHLP